MGPDCPLGHARCRPQAVPGLQAPSLASRAGCTTPRRLGLAGITELRDTTRYVRAVRRASFAEMPCSVAQALEVVGERWTLLVVRDCLLGVSRFDQLQQRLGIARNVLTDRLDLLVGHQVLERRPYQERPVRHEYVLTERGRDLWHVVHALQQWGDRWAEWPEGPPVEEVHRPCGHVASAVPTCSSCRGILHIDDLEARPGGHGSNVLP